MGTPLSERQKQVLAKIESIVGTAETLAAANGGIRITEANFEPMHPTYPRDVVRSSLTPIGALPGEKAGTITIKSEANTPDSITATDLEYDALLRPCSLTIQHTLGINIGTINLGPFTRNEIITDASANTGRCLLETANGATLIYYAPIAGTLQDAEVLTGGSSGATTLSASTSQRIGKNVKPISNNQETITLRYERDGYQHTLKGVMGSLKSTAEASRATIFEFVMQGPKHDYGDLAMTTGLTYQTEKPPINQGMECTVDGTTVVVHSVVFDEAAKVTLRVDGNADTTGYISSYIPRRESKVNIVMEATSASELDLWAKWESGDTVAVQYKTGTALGKRIYGFFDYCQVTDIKLGAADDIGTVEAEFTCTGQFNSSEDEFEIVFI